MSQYCIEVTKYILVDLETEPTRDLVDEMVAELKKSGNWTGTNLVTVLDENGDTVLEY